MKLIGSLTSPYVRKVRVALIEKRMDIAFKKEDVWSPDTAIGESNPLGKVPVLVLDDGTCLFDSRVIVEFLDARSPMHRLIPDSGRERAEVKVWEALADGCQDAPWPYCSSVNGLPRCSPMTGSPVRREKWMPRWRLCPVAWARALGVMAISFPWPILQWVSRWGICVSDSRKTIGKPPIRTCGRFMTN